MPIYDYQCTTCEYSDEVMRKVSASSEIEKCPSCGVVAFSKQLSAPSFQLNGTGWYATDFKNSGAKPKPSETKKAEPATSSNSTSDDTSNNGESCAPGCGCH